MNAISFIILFLCVSAGAQEGGPGLVKPQAENIESPAQMDPTVQASGSANDPVDKRVVLSSARNDERIENVLNQMAAKAGWFPSLKISVEGGVVVLEGKANKTAQLEWLAKTADRIPSVLAVINKAQIETPPVWDLSPAWDEFKALIEKAKRGMPLFLLAILLLTVFYFISRTVERAVRALWSRHVHNPFLLATVTRISMLPVWVLSFYLALQTAGLSGLAATIIGGTGALGIVLGLAFKDIGQNYLSGLLLAMRSPFTKGDLIHIDKYEGFVQNLNMRGTTITDYDGNMVLIPNTIVIQSVIRNLSTNPEIRASFAIGIGYSDSIPRAEALVYEALKTIPQILETPAPLVVATELKDSQVNLQVMYWFDSVKNSGFKVKSSAITAVKEILLAHGFNLPDPNREIVFPEPIVVHTKTAHTEPHVERRKEVQANARKNMAEDGDAGIHPAGHERDVEQVTSGAEILKRPGDNNLLNL